jgi:hypothetical protein
MGEEDDLFFLVLVAVSVPVSLTARDRSTSISSKTSSNPSRSLSNMYCSESRENMYSFTGVEAISSIRPMESDRRVSEEDRVSRAGGSCPNTCPCEVFPHQLIDLEIGSSRARSELTYNILLATLTALLFSPGVMIPSSGWTSLSSVRLVINSNGTRVPKSRCNYPPSEAYDQPSDPSS